MGKDSDLEKSLPAEQEKSSSSLWQRVVELIVLIATSVVLLVVFITNGLANVPNVGFANNTVDISDRFYLQVTPAGWTFSIWGGHLLLASALDPLHLVFRVPSLHPTHRVLDHSLAVHMW